MPRIHAKYHIIFSLRHSLSTGCVNSLEYVFGNHAPHLVVTPSGVAQDQWNEMHAATVITVKVFWLDTHPTWLSLQLG